MKIAVIASIVLMIWCPESHGNESGARLGPSLERLAREVELRGIEAARSMAVEMEVPLHPNASGTDRISVILEPSSARKAREFDTGPLSEMGIDVDAVSRSFIRVLAPLSALVKLNGYPGLRVVRLSTPRKAHTPAVQE